jgi:hypothetical protein
VTKKSVRAAPAPAGANLVSGSWRLLEADLTHHDEDTSFKVAAGSLTMTDHRDARSLPSLTAPI